jgi:hypothetical protein
MTNKAIYFLREFMAGAISVPENEIVINQAAIGGDFGGKGALMDSPLCSNWRLPFSSHSSVMRGLNPRIHFRLLHGSPEQVRR